MSGKSLEGQPFGPPRRQLPFTGEPREAARSYASPVGSKGERSEPRVRAFGPAVGRETIGVRAFGLAVGREATGVRAFGAANKPNGTPARRKAGWRGGSSISRPEHRSSSKNWFGAEIGEGACGPLPLAPNPKGTTPQSAAADSSPYTGEPILRCLFGSLYSSRGAVTKGDGGVAPTAPPTRRRFPSAARAWCAGLRGSGPRR